MRPIFPEWRDQQSNSNYPFVDVATLTNGTDTIPKNLFVDARVLAIGAINGLFLSAIDVQVESVAIQFSNPGETSWLVQGEYILSSGKGVITLADRYARPAGMLVGYVEQLQTLASWPLGLHVFTQEAAELSATAVVPTPEIGVRGFLVEGKVFAGDVYIVGEQGVFLTPEEGCIRVDIVGDPRSKQLFCEQLFNFEQPWFIRTINNIKPDEYGDFKLLAGANIATDTVLRLESSTNGIGFKLIGDLVANAPK